MKHLLFALLLISASASAQTGNYTHDVINPTGTSNQTYLMDVGIDTLSGSNDTLLVQFDRSFPGFYGITYTGVLAASSTSTTLKAELLGRNKSSETWVIIDMVELATEGVTISLESDLSYMYLALRYVSTANLAHVNSTILLKKKATSSSSVIKGTYTSIQSLVNNSMLKTGRTYEITDRGDRGIFLTAISPNKLSTNGHRLMLCPTTYATTGIWKGIWRSALLPSIGDLVIWDAHVYENNTGAVGTAPDGDATNWTIVPKASFSNGEYTEFVFGIVYDFSSDWISEQWDDSGNRIVIDEGYNQLTFDGLATNEYVNETDWNYLGHQNESGTNVFANNTCYGYIKNNIKADGTPCNIFNNRNAGGIYGNTCIDIDNNTNEGGIFSNTCQGISDNSNMGGISGNSNTGDIESNSNDRGITGNSNDGDIIMNYCVVLSDNSNGGDIRYNNIPGNIQDNTHDGLIGYNRNNGNIENCTGSGGFSVIYNTNNGDIDGPAGLASADVTDAIVNK